MGPDRNSELFRDVVGVTLLPRLGDEMERRELLADNLADLSHAFANHDPTAHQLTEPTMQRNLFALAAVQRTHLGVAGSNPIGAIDFRNAVGKVSARTAPPHDSFLSPKLNATVNTRAIMITVEKGRYEDDVAPGVEFFGLNLYVPEIAPIPDTPDGASITPKLIVVGGTGKVQSVRSHISGETPVIAVRNKDTGDAKVYALSTMPPEDYDNLDPAVHRKLQAGHLVMPAEGDSAYIQLPDGQVQMVVMLKDASLRQAADEFHAAAVALENGGPETLSQTERLAAQSALGS